MSATLIWAVGCTLASLVLLIPLALRDPKRLRSVAKQGHKAARPMESAMRRLLGWGSLLPGIALIVAGQWPALLIWLGAVTALAWSFTQSLAVAAASGTR